MKQGWEYKKLGEVCTIERGGSPRPITDYITDSEDGINWIKIGDAQEGSKYITSTKEKIRPEGIKKSRFVHKGDFILSNSMSFGRPYILKVDGCIHDGWLVIHDDNEVFIKDYLYYILSSSIMYAKFSQLAVGGVVNNLNSSLVRKVAIPIPPKSTQLSIVSELDKINELIRLRKEQLKDYDNLAQSIFYEMFGDLVENEKGWEVKKLKDISYEIGDGLHGTPEYTDTYTGCYFINGNNLEDGVIVIKDNTKMVSTKTKTMHYIEMDDYTILISINGTLGKIAFYNGENVILGKSACYIKLNKEQNKKYIYELLKSKYFKEYAEAECTGTTIRNVSLKSMRNFPVSIPPLPLQRLFAQRIEQIEHQKSEVTKAITDLETLLASRMQHWFE